MTMILIVDDEPIIRRLLVAALERDGFSVLTARNGVDAISVSQSHQGEIDLLITDLIMPEMDGVALAKAFSAGEPDIPVLFMSGHWDSRWIEELEGTGFLRKPFTIDTLLAKVHALLQETDMQLVS